MQYALIKENKVKNIIIADKDFADSISQEYDLVLDVTERIERGEQIGVGYDFEDDSFTRPQEILPAVVTPPEVNAGQFRLALLQRDLLVPVETAIANMQGYSKSVCDITWKYSSSIKRESEFVQFVFDVLQLQEDEVNDLFVLAKTL